MSDLERLRAHLSQALGDDRLRGVEPDAPLLQGGVVSSLELVVLLSALREGYGVQVSPARAAQELASLGAILDLVAGRRAAGEDPPVRPAWGLWRRLWARPWRALAGVLLALALVDQGFRLAVERALWSDYLRFREHGQRLYPVSGHLAQDDFAVAAEVHEVFTAPDPPQGWVVVLGDSGTIGSYFPPADAWPARAQVHAQAQGLELRVTNLAYFGRVLPKDLMLLELIRDEPLRAVVFTVGDDHLSEQLTGMWLRDYLHVSENLALLERYVARLPAPDQAPFARTLTTLRDADRRHAGWLWRLGYRHAGLTRYRHYVRDWLLDRALPDSVGTELKLAKLVSGQRLAAQGPQPVRSGLPPGDLDADQLAILRVAVSRLRARGVQVVLVLEPAGPREWRPPAAPRLQDTGPLYDALARETGAVLVDLRWSLNANQFTDNLAHYTAEGADVLGREVGAALAEALR